MLVVDLLGARIARNRLQRPQIVVEDAVEGFVVEGGLRRRGGRRRRCPCHGVGNVKGLHSGGHQVDRVG